MTRSTRTPSLTPAGKKKLAELQRISKGVEDELLLKVAAGLDPRYAQQPPK